MIKDKLIICYTSSRWEFPWGISQRIVTKLSKFNTIIYIEYQSSFLHYYFQGLSYVKSDPRKRGRFRKINSNLTVYSPRAGLPLNNYVRTINVLNQKGICKDIKLEIDKYDPKEIILWIFTPYAIDFINNLSNFFTIYHCAANFSAEKGNSLRKHTIFRMEQELISRSNMAIAQTKSLCRRFEALGKKTFYCPSAVDFDKFSENPQSKMSAELKFDKIKHPRIGIVGYFNDDFYDVDLLEYLVDAKPQWSFIFIGLITGKARNFRRLQKKSQHTLFRL